MTSDLNDSFIVGVVSSGCLGEEKNEILRRALNAYGQYFLDNPASTKYHHCEKGGFWRHLNEVAELSLKLVSCPGNLEPIFNHPCLDIVFYAFLHDLDKIGRYVPLPDGTFTYDKSVPYGNDVEKAYARYMELGVGEPDNLMKNVWAFHHSGWSEAFKKDKSLGGQHMHPYTIVIHAADMLSCHDEITGYKGV